MTWWCTGVRWRVGGGPALGWYGEGKGERESPLAFGDVLAFRAVGGRRCLGVWRGGRRTPCPVGAALSGRGTRAQCAECAGIDRAHSVAADTMADDPRPYHVYLAWFGSGMVKVGITGVGRGSARLLEQGAVAFTWLGCGPLMAARRAEELLRSALGVPDRIPYAQKRAVRAALPPAGERAGELAAAHATAVALVGWPESLERLPCDVVDHAEVFGIEGGVGGAGGVAGVGGVGGAGGEAGGGWLGGVGVVVSELVEGGVVVGTLVAAAGPDLHLVERMGSPLPERSRELGEGRRLVVDTRLLDGWQLEALAKEEGAAADVVSSVPVKPVKEVPALQGGLF
ncbi:MULTISPECIES: DUF2797 domain-containing protein [unclassified Streptomyces]|uniref:DUF2797 domain-containing protein n=1 Tax=unclassified Streptomyces TaxID=2593676 RepID=UPI0036E735F2